MMNTSNGFSLIEMVVVLLIISLLMGGLLSPLSSSLTHQKIKLTQQRLEEIKEALLGFAIINERLPCPAPDKNIVKFDIPDQIGVALKKDHLDCHKEGYLPWADLGVGRYDAWGNPFRYRVEKEYTSSIAANVYNKLRVRTIRYNDPDDPDSDDKKTWLSSKAIGTDTDTRVTAIIFSCGQNAIPDPTPPLPIPINYKSNDNKYHYSNDADGVRNSKATCENGDTSTLWKQSDVYIQEGYLENSFDDVVTWLSKNTLMNRLVIAGKWPPSAPSP